MKLKMIVAALAFAAAGSANAGIVDGSSNNGELFMTVLDSVGQKSYTLDLNVTMNDFLAGVAANTSYTYAADANMTAFLGSVANVSSLTFAIGAMDSSGTTAADYQRYISTASSIDLAVTKTNLDLKQLGTSGNQLLGNTNGLIGAADSVIVTDPSVVAYAGSAQWGSNWGGKANFVSTGLIGGDLGMYLAHQTTGAFAQRNNASVYEALTWMDGSQVNANLGTDGVLNIAYAAPVPEADTYALMLAGMGLVGFMARRRKAA